MRDRAYGVFDTSSIPCSDPGSPDKIEYAAEVGMDGNITLHEIGKTDLQSKIDSYEESCNINTILQRYAAGDESVLQRRQMLFFDASDMPTTYPEMYARLQQAEQFFEAQSVEFKDKYHGRWQEFLASLEDPQSVANLAKTLMDDEIRRANPAGDALDRTPNTADLERIGRNATNMAVAQKMADAAINPVKEVTDNA